MIFSFFYFRFCFSNYAFAVKKKSKNVALMTFRFAIVPVFDRFNLIALVQAHIKILVVRQLR